MQLTLSSFDDMRNHNLSKAIRIGLEPQNEAIFTHFISDNNIHCFLPNVLSCKNRVNCILLPMNNETTEIIRYIIINKCYLNLFTEFLAIYLKYEICCDLIPNNENFYRRYVNLDKYLQTYFDNPFYCSYKKLLIWIVENKKIKVTHKNVLNFIEFMKDDPELSFVLTHNHKVYNQLKIWYEETLSNPLPSFSNMKLPTNIVKKICNYVV